MNEQEKKAREVIENLEPIKSLESDKDIAIRELEKLLQDKTLVDDAINAINRTLGLLNGFSGYIPI